MRLIHVYIEGFQGFMFSNIESLSVDTSDILQIIIGTNGSGKSKFLSECSPLPSPRTSYKSHGYKSLVIEHRGNMYTLISDYTLKSGSHSFQENGVELNESGTTPVQEELVQSYLGYTPTVMPILTNTYGFGRMSPGARKTLLMTLNPFNITFMLEDHKHIVRKIKACKNNLSRLYARKSQLEESLLDESVRQKMRTDIEALTEKVASHVESLHKVSAHMATLRQQKQEIPITHDTDTLLQTVNSYVTDARRQARQYSDIPREDVDGYYERTLQDIATYTSRITSTERQIEETIRDIEQYQHYVEDMTDPELSLERLDADIDRLTKEMETSPTTLTEAPCSEDQLHHMEQTAQKAYDLLFDFQNCGVSLRSPTVIRRKQDKLTSAQDRLLTYRHAYQQVVEQLEDIDRKRSLSPEDIPEPCSQFACPLYRTFYEQFSSLEQKREPLVKRHRWLSHRLQRLERYVEALREQVSALKTYLPALTHLYRLMDDTCPLLGRVVSHLDILQILTQNPFTLNTQWEDFIDQAKTYFQYHKAQEELSTKREQRRQKEKINTSTQGVFDKILQEKHDTLVTLRTRVKQDKMALKDLKVKKENITAYKAFCHHLDHYQGLLQSHEKGQCYAYAYTVCQEIYTYLQKEKEDAVTRLGSLNHTLQEQDTLKARYDQEILSEIQDIEKTYEELVALEKALSPSTGIPHKYMTTFVNTIIKTMNHYISYVFSYPFVINEHDISQPLDYKFTAYVDDTYISPDISTCSDAQNEIIDLAFSLALIRHLNLSEYPLFLDETGKSFDVHHKHKLLDLFRHCIDEGRVSQLFLINHHAVVHEGMANAQVMVLDDTNILTPPIYNTHVEIQHN